MEMIPTSSIMDMIIQTRFANVDGHVSRSRLYFLCIIMSFYLHLSFNKSTQIYLVVWNNFHFLLYILGEMIQLDKHICLSGWLNHLLENLGTLW